MELWVQYLLAATFCMFVVDWYRTNTSNSLAVQVGVGALFLVTFLAGIVRLAEKFV